MSVPPVTLQPPGGHAMGSLLCPACRVDLVMADRMGVEIDYCPKCRGIWLDRGELDKIIEMSLRQSGGAGDAGRQDYPDTQSRPYPADGGYASSGHGGRGHSSGGHHGSGGHGGGHGGGGHGGGYGSHGGRRRSWLRDLFD